jgi:hypothetical protein
MLGSCEFRADGGVDYGRKNGRIGGKLHEGVDFRRI